MDLNEAEDWAWCDAQYAAIEAYVKTQNISHGLICDWPEWYVAPYIGLWAVEDLADPGFVGYWVLAGDTTGAQPQPVSFDFLSAQDCASPREALTAFAKKWAALAAAAAKGNAWTGSPLLAGDISQQATQLARQAELLKLWVSDDDMWEDD